MWSRIIATSSPTTAKLNNVISGADQMPGIPEFHVVSNQKTVSIGRIMNIDAINRLRNIALRAFRVGAASCRCHSLAACSRTISNQSCNKPEAYSTRLFVEPAVTTITAGIISEAIVQVLLAEFRPTFLGHPDFRIADLPQQEIAYSHLTGGANE